SEPPPPQTPTRPGRKPVLPPPQRYVPAEPKQYVFKKKKRYRLQINRQPRQDPLGQCAERTFTVMSRQRVSVTRMRASGASIEISRAEVQVMRRGAVPSTTRMSARAFGGAIAGRSAM